MKRDSSKEHDNVLKRTSRELITRKVNKHFRDFDKKKIFRVVELLGSGVGYKYYRHTRTGFKFSKKKIFYLIEKDKDKVIEFLDAHYGAFRNPSDFILYNTDVHSFFEKRKGESFDLINLDFCSYFTESLKQGYSPVDILKKMFEKKSLKNGGLLFTTFLQEGYLVELNKRWHHIETDKDAINCRIIEIAKDYGYDLKVMHEFSYHSTNGGRSGNSMMMNTGFILH